jgi:hypothetical protein
MSAMRCRVLLQTVVLCGLLAWLGIAGAHPGHHHDMPVRSAVWSGANAHVGSATLTAAVPASMLATPEHCPDPAGGCCCSGHRCTSQPPAQAAAPAPDVAVRIAVPDARSCTVREPSRVQFHELATTAQPRAPPIAS